MDIFANFNPTNLYIAYFAEYVLCLCKMYLLNNKMTRSTYFSTRYVQVYIETFITVYEEITLLNC